MSSRILRFSQGTAEENAWIGELSCGHTHATHSADAGLSLEREVTIYTTGQAARFFGVDQTTILNRIKRGELPGVRCGGPSYVVMPGA